MKLAIWGNGTEASPGLITDHRIFRAQMLAYFKAICVIGTVLAFLCMATLALLSYLAAHREHSQIVSGSTAAVAQNADTR